MDFNEYQKEAMLTDLSDQLPDDCNPLLYHSLKLCGEAGEIAEKIGKLFRDKQGRPSIEFIVDIEKEMGDCFWYLAALAKRLSISLNSVASGNLIKLKDRMERGVLHGNGDNR